MRSYVDVISVLWAGYMTGAMDDDGILTNFSLLLLTTKHLALFRYSNQFFSSLLFACYVSMIRTCCTLIWYDCLSLHSLSSAIKQPPQQAPTLSEKFQAIHSFFFHLLVFVHRSLFFLSSSPLASLSALLKLSSCRFFRLCSVLVVVARTQR